jgi:hypothetical protein
MLTMGISDSILAVRISLTNANVIGGLMSAYFVVTALTAVRRVTAWTRPLTAAALAVAVMLATVDVALGFQAWAAPRHRLNGVPFFMPFFLAVVTTSAAIGDLRVLRSGVLRARQRLSRHLWRMCFALFIAAGSFFSVRGRVAKVLPEPFTTPAMRALSVLLIFASMFYWLWRISSRKSRASSLNSRISVTSALRVGS